MRSPQEKLARYEQLIPLLHDTQTALWKLVDEGMMRTAWRVMGTASQCEFRPRDDDAIAMMLNYCCFNLFFDHGRTLTDLYAESQSPRDEDHRLILQAHQRSYFSFFEVVRLEPGVGAWVRDLLSDEGLLVVYPRLADSTRLGVVLAVRVMPVEDFHVLFNGPIPMQPVDSGDQYQAKVFDTYARYGVQKGRPLTAEQRGKIETLETIHVLSYRYPELLPDHVRQRRAAQAPAPAPAHPATPDRLAPGARAGRNDRCPCGSGKKFKQCCLGRN